MLGIAGLSATSIWQFRQSATAQQQAESQPRVAEMQAQNSWKIERADILSKNIATLASSGPETMEQRYGVLLSLARGNLLDPELAVSYALELGKDNAEYMQSVLATVPEKDYARLARAFTVSCQERFGMSPAVEMCNDKLAKRSAALATLFADDGQAALAGTTPGPLVLLKVSHRHLGLYFFLIYSPPAHKYCEGQFVESGERKQRIEHVSEAGTLNKHGRSSP